MAKNNLTDIGFTNCIICGGRVQIKKSTSTPRDTCPRVMTLDGVLVKSECERKKERRYQDGYRKRKKAEGEKEKKEFHEQTSFAVSKIDHITVKQDTSRRPRFCLKCGRKFTATGKYNRICSKCTADNKQLKNLRY
jgi:formylmethanofuran dehydrogenase subunit E